MAGQASPVNQGPTTTVDAILAELSAVNVGGQVYRSPLADYAQEIYDLGASYGVDPAFFLGTAYGESQYGLSGYNGYPTSIYNPQTGGGTWNWTSITHSAYGGECSPDSNGHCTIGDPRWGQYPDPVAGIQAFFELLTQEYYPLGQSNLNAIWWGIGGSCDPCVDGQHAYAPCSDNHGNCSSLDTVLAVMNRVAMTAGPIVPPLPEDASVGVLVASVLAVTIVQGARFLLAKV